VRKQPKNGPSVAMQVKTGRDAFRWISFKPPDPSTTGDQASQAHPHAIV
jgi:hypothetical protein